MGTTRNGKLKDRFSTICRVKHLSLKTERAYWSWVRSFVRHCGAKSSTDLCANAENKFSDFITAQARRGLSASSQNQAFNALIFLYREVEKIELGPLPEAERAKRPSRLPDLPGNHEEVIRLIHDIPGDCGLALRLIYGTALRISDALRLRLKDLDFASMEVLIRASKGDKDRIVPLPKSLEADLRELIARREIEHQQDLKSNRGWVFLPGLLGVKYPNLHYATDWQYLFASREFSRDPRSDNYGRHHLTPETIQNALRIARKNKGIKKRITPHSLRHASAREMERRGSPISEIQKCLGHADVETTMRYLGIGSGGKPKVIGPLD